MNKLYVQTESYWLKIVSKEDYTNEENHMFVMDNSWTESNEEKISKAWSDV